MLVVMRRRHQRKCSAQTDGQGIESRFVFFVAGSMKASMRSSNRIVAKRSVRALGGCVYSCLWLFAVQVSALEYTEVTWGFDGHAVHDQFNLLTVVVRNSDPKPFDGAVKLEQAQGFARIGGTEIKPCYLEPGAARMLQFYPRVTASSGWRLSDGKDKEDLDPPKEGIPAVVQLIDAEDPLQRGKQVRLFPHQRFPTMVGGAAGLFAVVVDYAPGFAPSQKSAFVDWVLAGGRLHVFMNRDKRYPDFDHPMLTLDSASYPVLGKSHTRMIGNGSIEWHGKSISDLTAADVSSFEPGVTSQDDANYYVPIDMTLFQELQNLTRLNIAWPLVYLAAIIYIVLLGPGHYLWVKRKKRDYRVVLIVLLGTVVVFAALFAIIGRRGYGERTQASTVSLACHIDGSRYDVTTWGNVFVTAGDDYEFRHASPHNLYSTGESYESVNATFMNGREGLMQTEIPVFSSRTFVHRGTLDGLDRPELLSDAGSGEQRTIVWHVPEAAVVEDAWVRIKDRIYTVAWDASRQRVTFIGRGQYHYHSENHTYFREASHSNQLSYTGRRLLHHTLGLVDDQKPKWVSPLDDGMIELFLLTSTPESFHLTGDAFAIQQGVTLYRYRYPAALHSTEPSTL